MYCRQYTKESVTSFNLSQDLHEVCTTILVFHTIETIGEVKCLTQVSKWQNWELNLGSLI